MSDPWYRKCSSLTTFVTWTYAVRARQIVVEDWSRTRLRDSLSDSGSGWHELDAIPMLAGKGREEIPVAPPQV